MAYGYLGDCLPWLQQYLVSIGGWLPWHLVAACLVFMVFTFFLGSPRYWGRGLPEPACCCGWERDHRHLQPEAERRGSRESEAQLQDTSRCYQWHQDVAKLHDHLLTRKRRRTRIISQMSCCLFHQVVECNFYLVEENLVPKHLRYICLLGDFCIQSKESGGNKTNQCCVNSMGCAG